MELAATRNKTFNNKDQLGSFLRGRGCTLKIDVDRLDSNLGIKAVGVGQLAIGQVPGNLPNFVLTVQQGTVPSSWMTAHLFVSWSF